MLGTQLTVRSRSNGSSGSTGAVHRRRALRRLVVAAPLMVAALGWPLIIRLLIQTIQQVPSGSAGIDRAPDLSWPDPPRAVHIDAEHTARLRARAESGEALWANRKGMDLANLAGDSLDEVITAAERGIQGGLRGSAQRLRQDL